MVNSLGFEFKRICIKMQLRNLAATSIHCRQMGHKQFTVWIRKFVVNCEIKFQFHLNFNSYSPKKNSNVADTRITGYQFTLFLNIF